MPTSIVNVLPAASGMSSPANGGAAVDLSTVSPASTNTALSQPVAQSGWQPQTRQEAYNHAMLLQSMGMVETQLEQSREEQKRVEEEFEEDEQHESGGVNLSSNVQGMSRHYWSESNRYITMGNNM